MRHLFFVLMIALLPLRGWMGDAMATQMAVQMAAPASGLAVPHVMAGSSMASGIAADCVEHTSGDAAASGGESADASCENCAACQACHTVALSADGHDQAASALPGSLPVGGIAPFASADPASGQKPPIS